MNGPEPSPDCEDGKKIYENWRNHPFTQFSNTGDPSRIGPAWKAFTEHLSVCPLCDRRAIKRIAA